MQSESRATGEAHQEGALDGATGAPSPPFCLNFFSSSCPINFSSPPTFQLSQINVSLLFIYMNIYINKYRIFRLFSHFGDCYHCIFFSSPSNFVYDSQDILITVIKHNTHKHTNTHTHAYGTLSPTLMHQFPALSLSPPHIPIPSTHSSHAQQRSYSAVMLESSENNCPKFDPVTSLSGVTV